ncbi:GerMN domain-containing protein [Agromyces lapidis]|uniref:GerMN domain-containing protein n=1 Tax=Agromyces lapidis TaxID=279574 RepID=A0ABV5SR68_9MICO|nr:GerMN domain-containing protein [Agromyces lapidis]
MRRRVLGASLALAVAALLSGCVALPTSGPVGVGNPDPVEESAELDTFVRPPQAGATPDQIVQGFIEAAASPRGNYDAARDFLTPEFSAEWQPGAGATIDVLADRSIEEPEVADDATETQLSVGATPAAALTSNGQYELPASAAEVTLPYRLERVDGEWRIAEAPKGILIDELTFGDVFRPYELAFFDPTFQYLVPDLRWFAGRDSAQTSIVRALLAGPAEWLAPGVETAFPEGVSLETSSVPIANGIASVELSGASFDDVLTVQRMQEQLDESLVGVVRNVDEVALAIDGAAQDVPPLDDPPVHDPPVDPRPVVFDGAAFGHLAASGDEIEPIEDISPQVEGLAVSAAAVGPRGESVAVRTPAGVSVVLPGEPAEVRDPRPGLITPAVDPEGVVWSVPATAPGELVAYLPSGEERERPIPVPWSGSTIAALEVSRDGTRIIALLGDGVRTRFVAASIERDADGMPIALGPVVLSLSGLAGTPRDVAWLDANTVASLTSLPGGDTRVVVEELGGVPETIAGPEGGIQLDAGNGERDLRVLTSSGDLDVQSGVGWQIRARGIDFVASQMPD